MKASCQAGHERRPMTYDHVNVVWRCSCGEFLTPQAIKHHTPLAYQPQSSPLGAMLQAMADYEIEGVNLGRGRITIEYPRPSLGESA